MTMAHVTSAAAPIMAPEIIAAAKALGAGGGGPGVAQLLTMLFDEQVDVDRLLRRLKAEPALAARVLKVANSAFYKRAGTVGTLERATQVLGLAAIRGIAAAGCMDRLPMPALAGSLCSEQFARHSLAVAAAAQALSQRAGAGVDAEAFTAGLLHDVGIVLLARLRPQAMSALSQQSMPNALAGLRAEHQVLGVEHTTCAALLAQTWGLPDWLVSALQAHHSPRSDGRVVGLDALPALLSLADNAASEAGIGLWPLCAAPLDPGALDALGLERAVCAEVAAGLPQALQRLTGAG